MNKSILLHQELGFGPDVVDHKIRLSYPSVPKQAIREKIKTETLSEEMRILYVAMTRAREKLIITATVNDIEKSIIKWSECANTKDSKLPEYKVLNSNSYLDWLAPSILKHKNCRELRNLIKSEVEFSGLLINDASSWKVTVHNKSEMANSKPVTDVKEDELLKWLEIGKLSQKEIDNTNEIERRLNWIYKYTKASKIPAKISVTEIKRQFESRNLEDGEDIRPYLPILAERPKFLEAKKGLTATEKGTVMHFVMQHLNFKRDNFEGQIEEMISKELLTEIQARSVDVAKIKIFVHSALGNRLIASKKVNREVPFNIEIPCKEIYPDIIADDYKDESILLQGIIDCYFEENDALILIDYKTDYVTNDNIESMRVKYALQINYYARALELLTGKRVKEKYVYLFSAGELVII